MFFEASQTEWRQPFHQSHVLVKATEMERSHVAMIAKVLDHNSRELKQGRLRQQENDKKLIGLY